MSKFPWSVISFIGPLLAFSVVSATPPVRVVGTARPLTPEGAIFQAPTWSPDGRWVAVTRPRYQGIYLIPFPEGGEPTELSSAAAIGFGMKWSPDSRAIAGRAAVFQGPIRRNALLVIDAVTGKAQRLTPWQTLMPGTPEWTADGRALYLSRAGKFSLTWIDVDTTTPAAGPLVFIRNGRLRVKWNSAAREETPPQPPGEPLNVTVAPQGERVAFEILGGHLWVMRLDGSEQRDLGFGYNPAWDPTGKRIVFEVTRDDGETLLESDLVVAEVESGRQVRLTATPNRLEMHPSWSPDGRWIAFDTYRDGRIFVVEVANEK